MPTCTSYTVKNNSWKLAASETATLGAKKENHAELKAYNRAPDHTGVVLLEIDDYPCEDCHAALKLASAQAGIGPIIVYVKANTGAYSSAHFQDRNGKPALKGSTPCVIYYLNGNPSYVTVMTAIANKGKSSAPAGMPAFPKYNDFVTDGPIMVTTTADE